MDYDNIGEIKYFLSDKEKISTNGYDLSAELKLLEQTIMRKKNSFMIASTQLDLLSRLGFVRVNGYAPSETTKTFLNKFSIKIDALFSYVRTQKNKTVELFFSDFELTSDGESFYYVIMKSFQDNSKSLGNGKLPFLYVYSDLYEAIPTYMFKYVDDFVEKTFISNMYTSYAHINKNYYPKDVAKEFEFYLSEVSFNDSNATTLLNYLVYGKIVSFYTIKRLLPDLNINMDSLAKRKTFIDDGHIELIKMLRYS